MCKKCKDRFCQFISDEFIVKCEFCEVKCKSQECLISFCKSFKTRNHTCRGKWCFFCKAEVELDHKCYILTESENNLKNKNSIKTAKGYIFFDYEAMQTD